ncbi:gliding motility lipoprotein GldH [Parabacteroides sp. Marseille-P3160]|uniref:gliding motility lipoprotein GldH n=1 Tax=Parabacteroides sp. Marseille-P3160 TaxID=1917887 RepID=UPI001F1B5CDF|nr:gliding motility lipoprotein GldH [Parabacteroides sp. Marseille-P3160]
MQIRKCLPGHKAGVALLLALFFASCGSPFVYDQYQVIEGTSWDKEKIYYFTFDIEDPSVPYEITLEIRNNNFYPYQNLWLFIGEERPIGPMVRDTIECLLADEFGKWKGRGITLFEFSYPLRKKYVFPHSGRYTLGIQQGMRDQRLPGIEEIGVRVEVAK